MVVLAFARTTIAYAIAKAIIVHVRYAKEKNKY